MFNSRQVPIDLQTVAPLFSSPEPVSDDRYAASFREWNFKNLTNSIKRARIFVIDCPDSAAEHRRVGHDRDLHSGKVEIKSELLRSVALRPAIESSSLLADQSKL